MIKEHKTYVNKLNIYFHEQQKSNYFVTSDEPNFILNINLN